LRTILAQKYENASMRIWCERRKRGDLSIVAAIWYGLVALLTVTISFKITGKSA
jgi:hypothetical protein